MRTRDIVGRTVTAIEQVTGYNSRLGQMTNSVRSIKLDSGVWLVPRVIEGEGYYDIDFIVVRPRPKAKVSDE